MNRRSLLVALAIMSVLPTTSAFADFEDDIVKALQRQGYKSIKVTHTLLGRTRIVATGPAGTRELIVNPRTGEILRDTLVGPSGNASSDRSVLGSGDSSSGSERESSSDSNSGSSESSGSSNASDGGDDHESDNSGSGSDDRGDDKDD